MDHIHIVSLIRGVTDLIRDTLNDCRHKSHFEAITCK